MKTKTTKTIKVKYWSDIPKNFTGIIEWQDRTKVWFKDGLRHREDGPAVETKIKTKCWLNSFFLEDREYHTINLKDHVVLDSYQGKYNLTWYKLLGKDKVIEYPDIPGLIEK